MRKPALCICKNKDADQLRGNRENDLRLCFHYLSISYTRNFKPLAIFCSCTAWLVSDLVGNPKFSTTKKTDIFSSKINKKPSFVATVLCEKRYSYKI